MELEKDAIKIKNKLWRLTFPISTAGKRCEQAYIASNILQLREKLQCIIPDSKQLYMPTYPTPLAGTFRKKNNLETNSVWLSGGGNIPLAAFDSYQRALSYELKNSNRKKFSTENCLSSTYQKNQAQYFSLRNPNQLITGNTDRRKSHLIRKENVVYHKPDPALGKNDRNRPQVADELLSLSFQKATISPLLFTLIPYDASTNGNGNSVKMEEEAVSETHIYKSLCMKSTQTRESKRCTVEDSVLANQSQAEHKYTLCKIAFPRKEDSSDKSMNISVGTSIKEVKFEKLQERKNYQNRVMHISPRQRETRLLFMPEPGEIPGSKNSALHEKYLCGIRFAVVEKTPSSERSSRNESTDASAKVLKQEKKVAGDDAHDAAVYERLKEPQENFSKHAFIEQNRDSPETKDCYLVSPEKKIQCDDFCKDLEVQRSIMNTKWCKSEETINEENYLKCDSENTNTVITCVAPEKNYEKEKTTEGKNKNVKPLVKNLVKEDERDHSTVIPEAPTLLQNHSNLQNEAINFNEKGPPVKGEGNISKETKKKENDESIEAIATSSSFPHDLQCSEANNISEELPLLNEIMSGLSAILHEKSQNQRAPCDSATNASDKATINAISDTENKISMYLNQIDFILQLLNRKVQKITTNEGFNEWFSRKKSFSNNCKPIYRHQAVCYYSFVKYQSSVRLRLERKSTRLRKEKRGFSRNDQMEEHVTKFPQNYATLRDEDYENMTHRLIHISDVTVPVLRNGQYSNKNSSLLRKFHKKVSRKRQYKLGVRRGKQRKTDYCYLAARADVNTMPLKKISGESIVKASSWILSKVTDHNHLKDTKTLQRKIKHSSNGMDSKGHVKCETSNNSFESPTRSRTHVLAPVRQFERAIKPLSKALNTGDDRTSSPLAVRKCVEVSKMPSELPLNLKKTQTTHMQQMENLHVVHDYAESVEMENPTLLQELRHSLSLNQSPEIQGIDPETPFDFLSINGESTSSPSETKFMELREHNLVAPAFSDEQIDKCRDINYSLLHTSGPKASKIAPTLKTEVFSAEETQNSKLDSLLNWHKGERLADHTQVSWVGPDEVDSSIAFGNNYFKQSAEDDEVSISNDTSIGSARSNASVTRTKPNRNSWSRDEQMFEKRKQEDVHSQDRDNSQEYGDCREAAEFHEIPKEAAGETGTAWYQEGELHPEELFFSYFEKSDKDSLYEISSESSAVLFPCDLSGGLNDSCFLAEDNENPSYADNNTKSVSPRIISQSTLRTSEEYATFNLPQLDSTNSKSEIIYPGDIPGKALITDVAMDYNKLESQDDFCCIAQESKIEEETSLWHEHTSYDHELEKKEPGNSRTRLSAEIAGMALHVLPRNHKVKPEPEVINLKDFKHQEETDFSKECGTYSDDNLRFIKLEDRVQSISSSQSVEIDGIHAMHIAKNEYTV